MKAILMAGGFGTRLRPLTINLPKPMVPIGNLPMMEHVVALLARHGITDITTLLYFSPDKIRDYFGDGSRFGVEMSYCLPDDDYGTAGAARLAIGEHLESVLVISGDLITDFDLTEAIAWHRQQEAEATILMTRTENPLQYGIVITDPQGRIVRFLEKPSWGEAFSDTINTGIYILEPSATDLIPNRANFDFSQNLFPLMLSRKMGLFGKVTQGYWKDVGNVTEYHRVHADLLANRLDLELKCTVRRETGVTLHLGENVQIEENVKLEGTVIIGSNAHIEAGSSIVNCVIGSDTRIGRSSQLRNSVLWDDNLIGTESEMDNAVVCEGCKLGRRVKLNDQTIVSDHCTIGDDAIIKANCKIWPDKSVDSGAIVSTSMVWGEKYNRELFTESKVVGIALSELTPEMAVRIGSAMGATLGQGTTVVTSRDASAISRLIRRGLLSGLLAAGVNVSDLETMPVPVVRFALSRGKFSAGIYVRHSPLDYRQIELIMFDGSGLDMPNSKLKRIERNYFGEDYERATMENIGHLDQPQGIMLNYCQDFISEIDVDLIREAGFKLVVDHAHGSSTQVFPTIFSNLGVATTQLNAYLDPRWFAISSAEENQAIVQASVIVKSLHADIGFLFNSVAEKLTVIDETGCPLDSQMLLLIMTELYLRVYSPSTIAVSVGASQGVEAIAREYGTEVVRVANDHRAMMDARRQGNAEFVGGTRGGFIFPGFQMGADAILASVKILEMMAKTKTHLGELRTKYEKYYRRSISIPCPWSRKGQVMRHLITNTSEHSRQLVDGVRIVEDETSILMTPDRTRAAFTLQVESTSSGEMDSLLNQYSNLIKEGQSG